MRRGSISSELLICGGGVRSILLLPLVARCREIIDIYIYLFCPGKTLCGYGCIYLLAALVLVDVMVMSSA